ncbi:UNKNOWN [Stylonychia lemnae]|uniref:Centrosomal protein of 162 kDa n=1 Tax=Stylonychia lemnae TaxID=5949 RepID=A0A078AA19_STYLE|nr:UNKNOWN [Stylonychia lemnae]|eukprot:CDW77663.1 UNKNOWN [Stylonychia lemnae]
MSYGRGRGAPMGGNYYKNNYALHDQDYDDDEDADEYGMYYEEDDSDDIDAQYAQNYPPGSLFQGVPKMGGGPMGMPGGPMGMGVAMTSASGVPFYGQQAKPQGGGGYTYGGIGGGAGAFVGGMGSQKPAGGGFTYGMASQGGNLFGPPSTTSPLTGGTQFGAPPTQNSNPGLFQFGKVSSMGGIGAFGSASAAGGLYGVGPSAVVENDPYANIAIDLNKVKKQEPPAKLYEHKTEEEKKKEAESKKNSSAASAGKSNLKKDFDEKKKKEDEDESKRKRSVSFGKSTTYEVEKLDSDQSTEFINKDNVGGRGSPRPGDKKVIAEKDLSDGRSDKEKILEMLERQQREQLEEMQALNESNKKHIEDSLGESSSLSMPNQTQLSNQGKAPINQLDKISSTKAQLADSNSYESDDFEDVSASGSGSKSKLVHWPGKEAFKGKDEEKVIPKKTDSDKYDANAMEAYMKKQQQNQPPLQKQKVQNYDNSESQSYDEDFESMSKSQTALTSSMLQSPKDINPKSNNSKAATSTNTNNQTKTFEYKPQVVPEYKSIADQYKKKENKFIQTDETKYDFMTPQQQTGTYKEWSLQQNLKDAENLIQDLKTTNAEQKDKIKELEVQLKKKDLDYQTMRRESMDATETAKRLQEQLKDSIHKNTLYKMEVEELIKQIDLADAKTRNKEDELKLASAEYDRKLKLQEERILFRIGKNEQREVTDLRRQQMIEKEEIESKCREMQEEVDYLMQKVTKLEVENKSLILGRDSNKKVKELQEEIDMLKHQLSSSYQVQQENINLRNIKNDLSKEDQVKLQRELQQLELMVKGYQDENEKALVKIKQLEKDLKMSQEKAYNETRRVKDLQQKALLNQDRVYVEENKDELDIQTVNNMGLGNAISQKTLQDLHQQLQKLQNEKQDFERDMSIKESQLKAQINKLRDEKTALEKQLIDTEFIVGDKNSEIQKLRDEFRVNKEQTNQQIGDLEEKIQWFRQNQRLIAEDDSDRESLLQELTQLREKSKKLETDVKRTIDLEKKCKLLEETIKSKNPNSIPMLIQAAKETVANEKQQNSTSDNQRVRQLEQQLEDKDKEYEKKLRTLRQEQERMKQLYEKRSGQTPEAKRVLELEDEIQKTKAYYNKRIREIEDKYKFRIPDKEESKTKGLSKPPTTQTQKDKPTIVVSDNKHYEELVDKITKERNLLAQKVVNLETANNKRRQSFSGNQPNSTPSFLIDDNKHAINAIFSISNLIKQNPQKDNAFSLIEAALSCIEQIKSKDPVKNKQISQNLLTLTQELNGTSQINDKILSDIMNLCKSDLTVSNQLQFNDLKLKHQHSAITPNKDIQSVMNSFIEEDHKVQKSPVSKPPKAVSHPFVLNNTQQARGIKDIMKLIVQSGLDFERAVKERQLNPKRLQLNQIYQLLREEEPSLKNVTLDEVKQLIRFVKDKSNIDSEEIFGNNQKQDELDLFDLVNVVMDVSLDVFKMSENDNPNESIIKVPTRYSNDNFMNKSPPISNEEVQRLKEQIRQLQQDKEISQGQQDKQNRLQTLIQQLNNEKRELQDKIEKLESSKQRVERILRQSVGHRGSMRKTNGTDIDSNEIIDELAVVLKRIEFLEQQSEDRDKMTYQEHGPCKREITRLQQDLEEERVDKQRLLSKKNAEVSYFKSELDALLSEMKHIITSKQKRTK